MSVISTAALSGLRRASASTSFPAERGPAPVRQPDGYELLTPTDRQLIHHATGLRIGPSYDARRDGSHPFAAQIAADRRVGRLSPGQDVSVAYLKDMARLYDEARTRNPFSGEAMVRALSFLAHRGAGGVDVSA